MTILFAMAMLLASDTTERVADLAANPPSMDVVAQRAAEDPDGYREVLAICAAYHGALAARPGDADAAAIKAHKDRAIMLLTAAGILPSTDLEELGKNYDDKVTSFVEEIDADTESGLAEDMNNLKLVCSPVEPYAEKQVAEVEAAAAAADAEAANAPPAT